MIERSQIESTAWERANMDNITGFEIHFGIDEMDVVSGKKIFRWYEGYKVFVFVMKDKTKIEVKIKI